MDTRQQWKEDKYILIKENLTQIYQQREAFSVGGLDY